MVDGLCVRVMHTKYIIYAKTRFSGKTKVVAAGQKMPGPLFWKLAHNASSLSIVFNAANAVASTDWTE